MDWDLFFILSATISHQFSWNSLSGEKRGAGAIFFFVNNVFNDASEGNNLPVKNKKTKQFLCIWINHLRI